MLEGQEIVEINFSLLSSVIDFRIESEYFSKKFIKIDKKLERIETISATKIANFKNGRPYSSDFFNSTDGVFISKIGDVTNKRSFEKWPMVEFDEFEKQKGSFLTSGDILMTLTGDPPDVGKTNYIHKPNNCSWNQRVAKVFLKNKDIYSSNEALYAVLSSEYSRTQLERFAKGIRQRNLGNESLDRLLLPKLSLTFQKSLESLIIKRFEFLEYSKEANFLAMSILLKNIGLQDFETKQTNNFQEISLSNSFNSTTRLDAEYYHPKPLFLIDQLKKKDYFLVKELFLS